MWYLKFPISFIKFKNASLCIHAGSGSVMFAISKDATTAGNQEDLTGSYIYACNRDGAHADNWEFYTFTSGC